MRPERQAPASSAGPALIENYRDYVPPPGTLEAVKLLLSHVPPEYLAGLGSIVLSNVDALNRDERRAKTWTRRRMVGLNRTLGWYTRATRNSPASIRLNIDRIEKSDAPWLRHVPLFRYYVLGSTLYHEIGHHIHLAHRPAYDGKENIADDWSKKLFRKFTRERYPVLSRVLRVVARVVRFFGWDKYGEKPPKFR
jgi:hypothetical protein